MIPRRPMISEHVENVENVNSTVTNDNVKRILTLLKSGEEAINMEGHREIALIIGMTGSGKSTLTHFLAGNNDELISKKSGVGEYVIIDMNNKISSNNTIISKTIFPEMVYDRETKTAYVDCPGFNDSRDEAYDIAAAYFIKKVIENVDNLKIILTVGYPSLRTGVSRTDFVQFLGQVSLLFGNIENYVDSVALVATKVDNSYDINEDTGVTTMVSDASIIANIATFLNEVKNSLKVMQDSNPVFNSPTLRKNKETFFKNSNVLLDALLSQNNGNYQKIQIFRRPIQPGKISHSKMLQKGKKSISEMITDNLKYSRIEKSRIGYAISDKSKNIIRELTSEINENITVDLAAIEDILTDHFKDLERSMFDDDMYALRDKLKTSFDLLSETIKIDFSASAEQMVSLLRTNMPSSCIHASESFLVDITNLGKFLKFMQELSTQKFDSYVWTWTKELQEGVTQVENLLKWYDFLVALHQRLSEYEIQKVTGTFTIPEFPSQARHLKDIPSFEDFFAKVSNRSLLDVITWKILKELPIDDIKIRYFNRVVESTIKSFTSFTTFTGNRLQVVGQFVKLSDVVAHPAYASSKSLQIFAKRVVFVDADIHKEFDVSIIAPRWEIIGSRLISLNGSPGRHLQHYKAPDATCYVCNGKDGLPGNPGTSAGHFFGIGKEFVNSLSLKITANGGTGGTGQHGGNGGSALDSETVALDGSYRLDCGFDEKCDIDLDYWRNDGAFCYGIKVETKITKYSRDGETGGPCGFGGAGGLGGYRGSITLLNSNNETPTFLSESVDGAEGPFGLHGVAGAGGKGGVNSWVKYRFHEGKGLTEHDEGIYGYSSDGENGFCVPDSSNLTANLEHRVQPTKKDFLYPPSDVIADYRTHLVENFQNCATKRHSWSFYESMEKPDILEYDSVHHIFTEFDHFQKTNKFVIDFTNQKKVLRSLARRIQRAAQITDSSNDQQQRNREILEFLSPAVTSELTKLRHEPGSGVVFDRKTYIDLMKKANMDELRLYFAETANTQLKNIDDLLRIINLDILETLEDLVDEMINSSTDDIGKINGRAFLKRKIFSNLKTTCQFLRLMNSVAVGDLSLVQNMHIKQTLPSVQIASSPIDKSPIYQKIQYIRGIFRREIDAIASAISKTRKSLKSPDQEFDTINDLLLNHEDDLHNMNSSLTQSIMDLQYQQIEQIAKTLENETETNISEAGKMLQNSIKIIKFDPYFHNEIYTDIDIERAVSVIDHLKEKASLADLESDLLKVIDPVLLKVEENIKGSQYKLEHPPTHWHDFVEALETIDQQINHPYYQLEISDDTQRVAEGLREIMRLLANLYRNIFPAQYDRTLIHALNSQIALTSVSVDNSSADLYKLVINNDLFYEYEHLVEAIKSFAFPMDILTSRKLQLPHFHPTDLYDKVISRNVLQLETELTGLEESARNYATENNFDDDNYNGALFTWRSTRYKEAIVKLLRGKKILLKATNPNRARELLKFDSIGVRFHLEDPLKQQGLHNVLRDFTLIMLHSGNSYYDLCGRIHRISSGFTEFTHKFQQSEAPPHVERTNNAMLSPYTSWIFQLVPNHENATFSNLAPYRGLHVDLQLEGHAQYMYLRNKTVCPKIEQRLFDNIDQQLDKSTPPSEASTEHLTSTSKKPQVARKRRHIPSPNSFASKFPQWLNPFRYFINTDKPLPQSDSINNGNLLQWNQQPSRAITPRPFDFNGSLALADLVLRNITKTKPYRYEEQSLRPEQARIIALNIIDDFENLLSELPDNEQFAKSDWQQSNPVELMSTLERQILVGDVKSMKRTLQRSIPSNYNVDGYIHEKLATILNLNLNNAQITGHTKNNFTTYNESLDGIVNITQTNPPITEVFPQNINQVLLD